MIGKIQKFINKILENNKLFWATLIAIFFLCRLATWFYPVNSDHWLFYYIGKNFSEGGILYIGAWDHKPPLIFVFNAIMHLLFGGNLILHRIFLTILTIFDIYLFYKLLQILVQKINQIYTDKIVKIGLILYIFFRNLSQFTSSGNNTENLGIIFLLLMFLSYLKFQEKKKWIYLFASGINLSILFYLKGNFIILSLPIVVGILTTSYKNIKRLILNTLIFALPLILQTALWLLYFYFHNALYDFFVGAYLFSSKYLRSTWAGNVSPHFIFIIILLPFFVPLLIFIVKFLKDYRLVVKEENYRFLFFLLLANLILGTAMGAFYPYYFLILLPGFILIILYSGNIFLEIKNKKNLLIVAILFLGMLLSFVISTKQFYNYFSGEARKEAVEFQAIGNYIKNNTGKDDKIIVYTYGATLYRLSERDSASRFVSASVLLLDEREGYGFNFSQTYIDEIEENKPKYCVFPKSEDDLYMQNKKIANYIQENFTEEKSFDEFIVLKNKALK